MLYSSYHFLHEYLIVYTNISWLKKWRIAKTLFILKYSSMSLWYFFQKVILI